MPNKTGVHLQNDSETTHESAAPVSWMHGVNIALGVWLIFNPFVSDYGSVRLFWNDIICGGLVVVLSYLAILTRRAWMPWAVAGIGLWLLLAPLVFWAPTATAYNTETLIGTLLVVLAVLAPGTVGARTGTGHESPPGWSYNPSSWSQRAPIVGLALLGFFFSRYMAAFQLGHIESVWEPFFGNGTEKVLTSDVSKAFPVSDAGLGAATYLMDALAGAIGGRRRWRTMPWIVIVFGIFIIPPGVTSIVLIMLQPISVGAWCSICLFVSLIMLLMVPPVIDEVIASIQFLLRRKRAGKGFWKTFWHGEKGDEADGELYENQPQQRRKDFSPGTMIAGLEVVSMPWNLALSTLLGVWLMAAPGVLGITDMAANSHYITGALVVTFSVVAAAEPARALRYLNILFGAWLFIAPWVLAGSTALSPWLSLLTGALLIATAFRRGNIQESFDGWDRYIV